VDWREHITSNPKIGSDKPILRDSRFKVEFVLKFMAANWTFEQMAAEDPGHRPEFLPFAAEVMRGEDRVAIAQAQDA
jgi:hypothetical protein